MPASQHQSPKSDIEISQAAKKRPILDIAKEKLGIAAENLEPYGHYKAKVSMDYIKSLKSKPNGNWKADLEALNENLEIPAKVYAEVKPSTQATAGPIYKCLGAVSKTVEIAGG